MSDKQKRALIITVLFAAVLIFIWGNSMLDRESSTALSRAVSRILRPVLEFFTGSADDIILRKLAHFAEFGGLGCVLAIIMLLRGRLGIGVAANYLFCGLLAALIDETVQLYTGRGSQVQDIWLDFAGVLAGFGAALLIGILVKRRRKK